MPVVSAENRNGIPFRNPAFRDFVNIEFCAACPYVFGISPVIDEDAGMSAIRFFIRRFFKEQTIQVCNIIFKVSDPVDPQMKHDQERKIQRCGNEHGPDNSRNIRMIHADQYSLH